MTRSRTLDTKGIQHCTPEMRQRTFGKTGDKVSVFGYSTMRLPVVNNDDDKIDYDDGMRLLAQAQTNWWKLGRRIILRCY